MNGLDPRSLREVEQSARAGAKSATKRTQVVRDAVEHTVSAWTLAVLGHEAIENPRSWAFRVGVNTARNLAARKTRTGFAQGEQRIAEKPSVSWSASIGSRGNVTVEEAKAMIASMGGQLTPNQNAVGTKMCEPGMTLRRAAKELGKDTSNTRRAWKSLLARLRRRFSGAK